MPGDCDSRIILQCKTLIPRQGVLLLKRRHSVQYIGFTTADKVILPLSACRPTVTDDCLLKPRFRKQRAHTASAAHTCIHIGLRKCHLHQTFIFLDRPENLLPVCPCHIASVILSFVKSFYIDRFNHRTDCSSLIWLCRNWSQRFFCCHIHEIIQQKELLGTKRHPEMSTFTGQFGVLRYCHLEWTPFLTFNT